MNLIMAQAYDETGAADRWSIVLGFLAIPCAIIIWQIWERLKDARQNERHIETLQNKVTELEKEKEWHGTFDETEREPDIGQPVVKAGNRADQSLKVIHIDDEDWILEIVGRTIRANKAFKNVTIQTFQNRNDAWQKLLHTDLDLLITDLRNDNVPGRTQNTGTNGFGMLTVLAQMQVKYPILVLSGSLSIEGYESKARRIAGNVLKVSFLKKPATSEQICSELSKLLGNKTRIDGQYNEADVMIFPEDFEFQIGGYCGTSHKIEHIGLGKLEYRYALTQYQWHEPIVLNPTRALWEQFLRDMDEIGVWKWESYANYGIRDGTYWTLALRIKDKILTSEGKNAFPGDTDSNGEPIGEFLLFLKAVQNLTGKDIR